MTNNPKGSFPRGQFPGYISWALSLRQLFGSKNTGQSSIGQLSSGQFSLGQLSGGQLSLGDNCPGTTIQEVIVREGGNYQGGGVIFLRGNCPDAELL